MQGAAIGGMVACGLLVGGVGGLGVAVASAAPGVTRDADSTQRGDRTPRAEDRTNEQDRKLNRRGPERARPAAEADTAEDGDADRWRGFTRRAVRTAGDEKSEGWSKRKGPREYPTWHRRHKDRHDFPDGQWRPPRDCDHHDPDPEEPTEPEVPDIVESGGGSDGPRIQWGVQRDQPEAAAEAETSTRTLDAEKVLRAAMAAPPPPPPPAAAVPVIAPVPVPVPVPVLVVPGPAAAPQPAVPPPPPPAPTADRPAADADVAAGRDDDRRAAPVVPAAFRAGYPDYLRTAAMTEIAGLALTGAAGLLGLTAAGGLVGYRQAKAGHAVRAAGTARFLQ